MTVASGTTSDRLGLAAVMLAVALGLFLRCAGLEDFPAGLHGDEAHTGLRGQAIRENGPIGVWDEIHSIGQPAGPSYVSAITTALVPPSIRAVRLPGAVAAAATLIGFAVFAALTLGDVRAVAVATTFYALNDSGLLLDRVAFPPVWGQAWVMAALVCLALAITARPASARALALVAGLCLATAPYFYIATAPLVGAVLVALALLERRSPVPCRLTPAVAVGVAVAACPALWQALVAHETMGRNGVGLPASPAALWAQIADILAAFFGTGRPDVVDGTGHFAVVPISLAIAAGIGLTRWPSRSAPARRAAIVLAVLTLAALATSAAFAGTGSGFFRRAMAALIGLCWLAGLGLRAAPASLVAVVLLTGYAEAGYRLVQLREAPILASTFLLSRTEVMRAVAALDTPPSLVYYASARQKWDYEVRQYLLPGQPGVDLSAEFGPAGGVLPGRFESGSLVVLAEGYLQLAADVRRHSEIVAERALVDRHGTTMAILFTVK